jgi:cytochrome c-type biogenesis protein CcmF
VTGSSLFSQKETFELKNGTTASFAGQMISLIDLKQERRANYTTVEATVTLTGAPGEVRTFRPERRFYDKAEEPSSEVAIQSDWKKDYYLTLAGWEDAGKSVAIQAIVNPLVSWIWTGGIVLSLGGIICLLPRILPHAATAQATHAVLPIAAPGKTKKIRKTLAGAHS